jgi:hypothetical protein
MAIGSAAKGVEPVGLETVHIRVVLETFELLEIRENISEIGYSRKSEVEEGIDEIPRSGGSCWR